MRNRIILKQLLVRSTVCLGSDACVNATQSVHALQQHTICDTRKVITQFSDCYEYAAHVLKTEVCKLYSTSAYLYSRECVIFYLGT